MRPESVYGPDRPRKPGGSGGGCRPWLVIVTLAIFLAAEVVGQTNRFSLAAFAAICAAIAWLLLDTTGLLVLDPFPRRALEVASAGLMGFTLWAVMLLFGRSRSVSNPRLGSAHDAWVTELSKQAAGIAATEAKEDRMEAAGTRRSAPTVAAALALVILLVGCGSEATAAKQTSKQVAPERTTGHATDTAGQTDRQRNTGLATDGHLVVAAGDIASCESQGDEATADLLATIDGTVLALGDEAYDEGSTAEFRDCYYPTWGRFAARTKPAPGNHEYETAGAKGYVDYFGKAAGDPGKGYYSYDLGNRHLVSLNSNCEEIGGCDSSSPQVRWLKSEERLRPNRRAVADLDI